MRSALSVLAFALLVSMGASGAYGFLSPARPVAACEEDATLIGVGDFEHGRWTRYECGPAVDDLR